MGTGPTINEHTPQQNAVQLIHELSASFNVVGSSLLEYVADENQDNDRFLATLSDALIGSFR